MHDITIDTNFRSGGPPPPPQPEKLEPLGPPPPQPELKLEPQGPPPPPPPELSLELLEPPPGDTLVTHSNPLAGDHHEAGVPIPHHETFSTAIQPSYSSTKG